MGWLIDGGFLTHGVRGSNFEMTRQRRVYIIGTRCILL